MGSTCDINPGVFARDEVQRHLDEVRATRRLIDRVDHWLYDRVRPYLGQRVLEIGAGHGHFVRHLLDRELVMATDHEPSAVAAVRRQYAEHDNVVAEVFDACGVVDTRLRGLAFDTVLSVNTLEHIEDDALALKNAARILGGRGTLVTVVPAHMRAYGRMDEAIGHYRRYNKRMLADRLVAAGFAPVKQFYVNLVGLMGWLVNGRLLARTTPPRGQLGLFNHIVPVLRAVEGFVRPPAGLSLVSVATPGGSTTQV